MTFFDMGSNNTFNRISWGEYWGKEPINKEEYTFTRSIDPKRKLKGWIVADGYTEGYDWSYSEDWVFVTKL